MALIRFKDAYPNHSDTFQQSNGIAANIDDYSVYTNPENKIGSVKDMLFEDMTGNIRYLVVDTGFWIFGKNVLLPIGLAHFDNEHNRVYIDGLTKQQVENLPEYHENTTVDRDYEQRVRESYRTQGTNRSRQYQGKEYRADEHRAYPGSAALYGATEQSAGTSTPLSSNQPAVEGQFAYDQEPGLFGMDKNTHEPIRLYQERLIADKERFKSGSVSVGKRVKSETQEVSVPVENERVVVERHAPNNPQRAEGNPDFREGEVARVDTYGEKADIHKDSFVREEVDVHKEVDRDTVKGREKLRREELDVNTKGNPNVTRR